jgi:hypothetical protein
MPYQQVLTGELLAAIEEHEIEPLVYEAAGQSIAWFNELTSVKDIVARLTRETEAALDEMSGLFARRSPAGIRSAAGIV